MLKKILIASVALVGAAIPFACGGGTAGSSGRSQSCSSTGECKAGLICLNEICINNDYPVDTLAKECVLVQCEADAECCTNFNPSFECTSYAELCEQQQQQQGMGGFIGFDYCAALEDLDCECNITCVDSQCTLPEVECEEDIGCFGTGLPICDTASGECVECLATEDCDEEAGETCIDNACDAPCLVNEDCPLFFSCEEGKCEDTGCVEDRDCILYTGDADSKCQTVEGSDRPQCRTPCVENSDCNMALNVCQEGVCMFLGCANDEQCRSYFHIDENDPEPRPRAKCVDPNEAPPATGEGADEDL